MKLKPSSLLTGPSRVALALALCATAGTALAQKAGGVLRIYLRDNPPSASIHEEGTSSTQNSFMPLFNNLVLFDQQTKRDEPDNIRGDLATEWAWGDGGKQLKFKLAPGVKWHDGRPFTAADVKCTWDTLSGKRDAGWRKNLRAGWYTHLDEVVVNGDLEVTFKLKRPQPSFLSFLASGFSPVYPCHVDGRTMRTAPIGTGPFKLAEFKPNEVIRLVRNPDYFKKGKPHLDGIEYRIIANQGTRVLSFISGNVDMTWAEISPEIEKDILRQRPEAVCELSVKPTVGQVVINPNNAKLRDAKLRRAIALAIDRSAIESATSHGFGRATGVMMAPPAGAWGLSAADLAAAPGYGKDIAKNREQARALMRELGYGPDKPLRLKMMAVNRQPHTVPSLIFLDQLRSIYIEGSLETVEIAVWAQRVAKRADDEIAYQSHAPALDDPDVNLYQGYKCGSLANYGDYCDKQMDAQIDEQSSTIDQAKRLKLVREIDRRLQMDAVRPVLHTTYNGYCRSPAVRGIVHPSNSLYNSYRYEDAWLDR